MTGDGYAQQLADFLKQWAEAINSIAAGTNAKITDVINSDYFVLDTETLPEGLTVDWANDPSGSTLVWDIGSIPANRDEVSFTIRLTEEGLANISEDG